MNLKIKIFYNENFSIVLMDEMKMQSNFVWDKQTGKLIGYVDLGDTELNDATLEKTDIIVTHWYFLFATLLIGSFSVANFATSGAYLFPGKPLVFSNF